MVILNDFLFTITTKTTTNHPLIPKRSHALCCRSSRSFASSASRCRRSCSSSDWPRARFFGSGLEGKSLFSFCTGPFVFFNKSFFEVSSVESVYLWSAWRQMFQWLGQTLDMQLQSCFFSTGWLCVVKLECAINDCLVSACVFSSFHGRAISRVFCRWWVACGSLDGHKHSFLWMCFHFFVWLNLLSGVYKWCCFIPGLFAEQGFILWIDRTCLSCLSTNELGS